MAKKYTFDDCVSYAEKHGISFNVVPRTNMMYDGLTVFISDAYDGYLSTEIIDIVPELFGNVCFIAHERYMFKKDYELVNRINSVLCNYPLMLWQAAYGYDTDVWYGASC